MNGCHACQDSLLDLLYGLLDQASEQALNAHLTECAGCRLALEAARSQQRLLATAARKDFSTVSFTPPSDEVAEPVLLPMRRQAPPLRRWPGWVAAACVLFVLSPLAIPAYRAAAGLSSARATADATDAAVADANKALADANHKLALARAERDRKLAEVDREVKARELRVVVSGPRTIQPGAPAEYQVRTFTPEGKPADADLAVKLASVRSEGKGEAVTLAPGTGKGEAKADAKPAIDASPLVRRVEKGLYRVTLPPTTPVDAGRTLAMAVTATRQGMKKDDDSKPVSLAGNVRLTRPVYLTHLTTDRPMYQPGDTVYFRSLTLDRATLKPPSEALQLRYTLTPPTGPARHIAMGNTNLNYLEVAKKSLAEMKGPDGKQVAGIGAGEVLLDPASTTGGEYTLTVSEEYGRFQPVSRRFLVNEYQKPRLDRKLELNRPSYGPRDEVQVLARAKRFDGGPLGECQIEGSLVVDGKSAGTASGKLDASGEAILRFKIPPQLERGIASVSVKFNAPGTPETSTRPVPIVMNKLDVEFFPEGGDLVAELPCRVYFSARTPAGKPAQVTGTLLEDGEPLPVQASTLSDDREPGVNQGLGSFSFTPKTGKTYSFRIDTPRGITRASPLPIVKNDGVAIRVEQGVHYPEEPVTVRVESTRRRHLLVGAYCRDALLDSAQLEPGQTKALLHSSSPDGGVVRITVFEVLPADGEQKGLKPVAERLVFRHPRKRVDLSLVPGKKSYSPAEKATMKLFAMDDKERPVPVIAQVAVIDEGTRSLADERTFRTGPTHFLLTSEVRRAEDLEHADFLIGQHPKAPAVLDHLLGTQGWRRFAEQGPLEFRHHMKRAGEGLPEAERQQRAEDGERLLVMIGQSARRTTDFDEERREKAEAEYEELADSLSAKHSEAAAVIARAASDPAYVAAVRTLANGDRFLRQGRAIAIPILFLLAGWTAVFALWRAVQRKFAWLSGAVAGVFVGLLIWLGQMPAGVSVPTPLPGQVAILLDDFRQVENEAAQAFPEPGPKGGTKGDKSVDDTDTSGEGKFGGAVPPGMAPPMAPGGPADPVRKRPVREIKAEKYSPAPLGEGNAFHLAQRKRDAELRRLADAKDLRDIPARGGRGSGGFHHPGMQDGIDRWGVEGKAKGRKPTAASYPSLVIREYAHVRPADLPIGTRADFSETVYWHPVLVMPDGTGEVSFQLSDSVTKYQATAFAHTLDGRLGSATKLLESRLPVNIAAKLPVEVTASDRILAPVAVSSTVAEPLSGKINVTGSEGLDIESRSFAFALPPEGSRRVMMTIRPTLREGQAALSFDARGDGFTGDAVRNSIRIVPDGFPIEGSSSDLLEKSATHKITLPSDIVPGTLRIRVDVYPSPLADLAKGLEGLLREPSGCFEQTSTSNYPNVMVLDFLKATGQPSPAVESKARALLARGYGRLVSFECQDSSTKAKRGYEWFGGTAPPHDALTAYGLLQFSDMARLHPVDAAMLKRTRDYLLSLRDGKGGFTKSTRALDQFGHAPAHITAAYIVWALTSTGDDDLATEQADLVAKASKSDDGYFVSLVALGLANRGKIKDAKELLGRIAKAQKADGHVDAETSITRSGGTDLQIEATSLALMGWLKVDRITFARNVAFATKWIGTQRQGSGSFGSTQATILALKALITQANTSEVAKDADLVLYVAEREVARTTVPARSRGAVTLEIPAPEGLFKAGSTTKVRAELSGQAAYPHTLSWSFRSVKPANEATQLVKLTTTLSRKEMTEGDTARLTVRVVNLTGQPQGMVTAIVGLPAGLTLPTNLEQLRGLCKLPADGKAPHLSAFELKGRELILYWRSLDKGQSVEVPVDVVASVPGTYRGPASRAYLYYNARSKHWVDPLAVEIKPVD